MKRATSSANLSDTVSCKSAGTNRSGTAAKQQKKDAKKKKAESQAKRRKLNKRAPGPKCDLCGAKAKDTQMFDPRMEADERAELVTEMSACVKCVNFVFQELPGTTFDELVRDKEDDEQLSAELDTARCHIIGNPQLDKLNTLEATTGDILGYQIYEKRYVLNFNQVVQEYSKTPKSICLQPIRMVATPKPKVVYFVRRSPENSHFRDKYPTAKIFSTTQDQVSSKTNPQSSGKRLFSQQSQYLLRSTQRQSMTVGGEDDQEDFDDVKTFMQVYAHAPGHQELLDRAAKLSERWGKKKSKSAYELEEEDQVSEQEVIDDETQADNESNPRTPCSSPRGDRAGGSTLGASVSSRDTAEPNPNAVGSMDYWIYELKLSHGFDDVKVGRSLRQAKDKCPKLGQAERMKLEEHVDHYERSVKLCYKVVGNYDNSKLEDLWRPLAAAGANPTSKLRIACFERNVKNTWDSFEVPGDFEYRRKIYKDLLQITCLWYTEERQRSGFDIAKTTLLQTKTGGKAMAKLFVNSIFSRGTTKSINMGVEFVGMVQMIATEAIAYWAVPEDADIQDEPALALVDGVEAFKLLVALAEDSITETTDVSVFQNLDKFDKACDGDDVSSPLRIIGAALRDSPHWAEKLNSCLKFAKALEQHGKHIQQKIKLIASLGADATSSNASTIISTVDEIIYWEASIPGKPICAHLRQKLLESSTKIVKKLTCEPDDEEKNDDRAIRANEYKAVLKALLKIFPGSSDIRALQEKLNKSLASLDQDSRQSMLVSGVQKWTEDGDEPTLKLQDAIQSCKGVKFSEETRKKTLDLWNTIFNKVAANDGEGFLEQKATNFTILDLLANISEDQAGQARQNMAKLLQAVHRLKQLTTSTRKFIADNEGGDKQDDLDRMSHDLLRSKQRADELIAKNQKSPFMTMHATLKGNLDTTIASAKTVIEEIAIASRDKIVDKAKAMKIDLQKVMKDDANYGQWIEKLGTATSEDELKSSFEDKFQHSITDSWLAKAADMLELVKSIVMKTNTFDIMPIDQILKEMRDVIIEARIASCSQAIMASMVDTNVAKDKIVLRKQMRRVQADMKTFELKPDQLANESLISFFKRGLAMN